MAIQGGPTMAPADHQESSIDGPDADGALAQQITEQVAKANRLRREDETDDAERLMIAAAYQAEERGLHETEPGLVVPVWVMLGRTRARSGAHAAALGAFERAEALCRHAGDDLVLAKVLQRLARSAQRADNHERAAKALAEAQRIYDAASQPAKAAGVIAERARMAFESRDFAAARKGFESVRGLARERDDRPALADAENDLGNVLAATGDLQGALEHYGEAEQLFRDLDLSEGLADCHRNTARAKALLASVVSPEDSEPPAGATWAPVARRSSDQGDKEIGTQLAAYRLALQETARLFPLAAGARNLNDALDATLSATLEIIGAERAAVLLHGRSGALEFHRGRNSAGEVLDGETMRVSRTITAAVAANGRALYAEDLKADPELAAASSIQDQGLRSAMAAALRLPATEAALAASGESQDTPAPVTEDHAAVMGVLYVDSRSKGHFGELEVLLFEAVASAAAQALRTTRLAQALRKEKDRTDALNEALSRSVERQERELVVARASRDRARRQLSLRHDYGNIIHVSPKMREVLRLLDRVTETQLPVLITGESGTGKELIARAIHENGQRKEAAFVSVNCAALSGTVLESELFGHVKGSFTGAVDDRPGLFEMANEGTLFLDEIGDMPVEMQSRLLRALQEGEIRPVGGKSVMKVDVRVVAATHQKLRDMVRDGQFREDLYYRLNVITVGVPPLRDRREDILPLCAHFLDQIARVEAQQAGSPDAVLQISLEREAQALLTRYRWPGNVRELLNTLRALSTFATDGIITEEATARILADQPHSSNSDGSSGVIPEDQSLKDIERLCIEQRLNAYSWRQTETARSLGIDRKTLYRKIRDYELSPDHPSSSSD